MKKLPGIAPFLIAAVCMGSMAFAQPSVSKSDLSTTDLIEKHISAIGGASVLGKHTSSVFRGTVKVQGLEGTIESYTEAPAKSYQKVDLKVLVQEAGYDGNKGWRKDQGGLRELAGKELEQARENAINHKILRHDDPEIFTEIKMLGSGKVDGRDVHKLEFTQKSGSTHISHYDAETYLEIKRVSDATLGETKISREVFYDDYREVDGVKVPFVVRQVTAFNETLIEIDAYEFNMDVDDALFQMPEN